MRNFWPGAAVTWMIFIGFVCLARFDDLPSVTIGFAPTDKIVHGALHLVLTILLFKALRTRPLLGAFCISAAFGILIEVMQSYLTTFRTADATDVMANIAGSILAIGIVKSVQKNKHS